MKPLLEVHQEITSWSDGIGRAGLGEFAEWGVNSFMGNMTPATETVDDAFRLTIFRLFGRSPEGQFPDRWGFKETRHSLLFVQNFVRLFPKAKVLFITRHVNDVACSLASWEIAPEIEWEHDWTDAALSQWTEATSDIFQGGHRAVLPIRYEDLTASPAATIKKIEKHLDLASGSLDADVMQHKVHGPSVSGRKARTKVTFAELRPEIRKRLESAEVSAALSIAEYS